MQKAFIYYTGSLKEMIKVSVIIPVYNEEKDIRACLESLRKQSLKEKEVIVVDDGSTDGTREAVQEYREVKLLTGTHKGPGASRNLGAKKARGKYLIFVDADMTFSANYLKNLIAPLERDATLIGTCHDYEIVTNTSNIWSRCWGKIRVSKEQAKDVKIFRAIRTKVFLAKGGFDPRYGYADDQTLWFKHGLKSVPAPHTTCYHRNPETLSGVYKQSRWIGASFDAWPLQVQVIKYFVPLFAFLVSPIMVPLVTIKRTFMMKEYTIIPQMLLFVIIRYVGTFFGLARKLYFQTNVR